MVKYISNKKNSRIVDKHCDNEIENYIVDFVRNGLDEVYINNNRIQLSDDYVSKEIRDGKICVNGYGIDAVWSLENLVDTILAEFGEEWYLMSDEKKQEYLKSLFCYEDGENDKKE